MATAATLISEQTLEAQVAGPDGATRLFVATGLASFTLQVQNSAAGVTETQEGTFFLNVGPQLTVQQFRKAVATASLSSLRAVGDHSFTQWRIAEVDADFDEEAGRVRLEFEVHVGVEGPATGNTTSLFGVGIQVTILAAI